METMDLVVLYPFGLQGVLLTSALGKRRGQGGARPHRLPGNHVQLYTVPS